MTNKRTKLEITRDILRALKDSRSLKITRLIYKSNLSNNSIKPYVKNLLDSGLIEISGEQEKQFQITVKGREFLEEFSKIRILTESYGI